MIKYAGKFMKISVKKLLAHIGLIAVVAVWGITPILSKNVLSSYSPALLVGIRGAIGAICLLLLRINKLKNFSAAYFKIGVPTGIILAAAYISQMAGLKFTTSAKTAFLENLSVVTVPIVLLILKKKVAKIKFISAALCFLGAGIIAFNGLKGEFGIGVGEILVSLAGILFGLNMAFTGLFTKDLDPLLFVVVQLTVLSAVSFGYAFVFEDISYSLATVDILSVLVLGVVSTAFCWAVRTFAFKHVSITLVAVFMPLSAVITGVISVLMGTDDLSWQLLMGGTIIVSAIILSELNDEKNKS